MKFSKGMTPWNKGKLGVQKVSEETRKRISKKMKGRPSPMKGKKHSKETKTKMSLCKKGEKAYNWTVKNVSYSTLHKWVNRWKLKPDGCENCGKVKNRMSWANIDHKYRRLLEDYIFLCPKCHGQYDKLNNLRKNHGE